MPKSRQKPAGAPSKYPFASGFIGFLLTSAAGGRWIGRDIADEVGAEVRRARGAKPQGQGLIDEATISRWKNGHVRPNDTNLKALAKALRSKAGDPGPTTQEFQSAIALAFDIDERGPRHADQNNRLIRDYLEWVDVADLESPKGKSTARRLKLEVRLADGSHPETAALRQLFRDKFEYDMGRSCIGNEVRLTGQIEVSTRNLSVLDPKQRMAPRIAPAAAAALGDRPFFGVTRDEDFAALADLAQALGRKVVIRCPPLLTGAYCVCKWLQRRADIEIDMSDETSSKLAARLRMEAVCDFVVAADGPMFAADGGFRNEFRRELPLFTMQNAAVQLKAKKSAAAPVMWIYEGSASELHLALALRDGSGVALPPFSTLKAMPLSAIRRADEILAPGDYVLAWYPLCTDLGRRPGMRLLKETSFDFHSSLYSALSLDSRRAAVDAFVRLFVAGWILLKKDSRLAIELAITDAAMYEALVVGAGADLSPPDAGV